MRKYWLSLFILLQLLLFFIGFNRQITSPLSFQFEDLYDGMKNYFTLQTYVQEPIDEAGIFHYSGMNYPYGDAVWFLDNTPIISVPLRWVNDHLFTLEDYICTISSLSSMAPIGDFGVL